MDSRLLLTLFLGVLLAALDIAILGPALPAIRQEFGVQPHVASWLISGYVLANLVGTPLLGRLSDRLGRRQSYHLSLAIFVVGSIGVFTAPSMAWIVFSRVLQGFGAGGIFPVATAVVGESISPSRRGQALGLLGATFGLAFLVGPPLGGAILAHAHWRWIFGINLPLGALVMWMAWKYLPKQSVTLPKPFDWKGLSTLGGGLVLAAIGISRFGSSDGFGFAWTWIPLVVGAFLLTRVAEIERKAADPIVPPSLVQSPIVRNIFLLGLGAGIGEVGVMLLPDLAVQTLGLSPAAGSMLLIPLVGGMTLAAPIAGRLLDRIGARPILIAGVLLQSVSMLAFMALKTGAYLFYVFGPLLGVGLACLLAGPLRWLLLRHAPAEQRTGSQALLSLSHSVGQIATAAGLGAIATRLGGTHPGSGLKLAMGFAGATSLLLLVPAWTIPGRDAEPAADPA